MPSREGQGCWDYDEDVSESRPRDVQTYLTAPQSRLDTKLHVPRKEKARHEARLLPRRELPADERHTERVHIRLPDGASGATPKLFSNNYSKQPTRARAAQPDD